MAWDFSTEPEFQEQLDWMREFVREEIWPIETVFERARPGGVQRAIAPLKEQVKERGLWAAHLDARARRPGLRPGQARPDARDPRHARRSRRRRSATPAPDSGNSEVLAMAGTEDQKERTCIRCWPATCASAFSMTEPENAGSDPTLLQTRAVRDGDEWVINGHKWFSSNGSIADFLIVMAVTDPDAHPYQRASMFIVPADTPGVEIVRDMPTMEHPDEHFGRFGGHAEILLPGRARARPTRCSAREGAGFLIAQQRLGPGRIHHCMRWLGVSRRAFDMLCERAISRYAHGSLLCGEADGPELDRRLGRADAGRAADDAARGVEDGHARAPRRRARRSR